MKTTPRRNLDEEKVQGPDCCTCAERSSCARFLEGSWCTKWHSRDPEKQGIDPNQAWIRGDPAEF